MRSVESVREVKDLQRHYAHLGAIGDADAMALLFADDAAWEWAGERRHGRAAIAAWLQRDAATWNAGRGGALHLEVIDQPVIHIANDGEVAFGRWQSKRFLGNGEGTARIEAGLYENEYRLGETGWKISALRYFPLYDGDYEDGWTNSGNDGVPIVARHYTSDEAGTPVPDVVRVTSFGHGDAPDLVAELAMRIERLNAEDDVRNLQHIYGYYLDRRMWSDVEDLFDDSGTVRLRGVEYAGADGLRRALETMGPEGLSEGILNDRVMFDVVVDVHAGGATATSQGFAVGLLSDGDDGTAAWEFSAFTNRFTRSDGIWRIQEVVVSRIVQAPYDIGWGSGADAAVRGPEDSRNLVPIGHAWRPHLVQRATLRPASGPVAVAGDREAVLRDLERRLDRSRAYDAVENLSGAYAYDLDDFQWPRMAGLFAEDGHKQSPFAGYYLGRDRILEAATTSHGPPKPLDALRERLVVHWRPQSVVMVSHDGRSANLRTRLFQTRSAKQVMPEWTGIHSGSYPNDQAVLEGGVWRLWSVTIDEYYFTSPSWSGGWSSAQRRGEQDAAPPASPLLESCPPDIPLAELGDRALGFRGGPGRTIVWPEIVPMWFHYRNPVSGRTPDHYWPDCVPSDRAPETSMTRHGYQLPPTGPSIDGTDVIPGPASLTAIGLGGRPS